MKFSSFVILALTSVSAVDAFAPVSQKPFRTPTQVFSEKPKNQWGPVAAAIAGWTLATQMVTALVPASNFSPEAPSAQEQSSTLVSLGAPSFGGGKTFDTLDFSLPSYDEAAKGGDISSSKGAPPSFNPFGDFQPKIIEDEKFAAEATKAEAKVAEQQAKAEAKAAKEAKNAEKEQQAKAEEKAAKEAKKAEKEQQAKAEEKAAKEAKKAEKETAPRTEEPETTSALPSMGDMKLPEFTAPDIKLNVPSFQAPDLSDLKSKFSLPKIDLKIPTPGGGGGGGSTTSDIPSFGGEAAPSFKVDLPKVSLPSIPNPFSGRGSTQDEGEFLEPQGVRDEKAREARGVFLAADDDAKVVEVQARELRKLANDKKKLANLAKDEACKTRPGGKWICLRNPFTAGF